MRTCMPSGSSPSGGEASEACAVRQLPSSSCSGCSGCTSTHLTELGEQLATHMAKFVVLVIMCATILAAISLSTY